MQKVVAVMTMSLDGFVNDRNGDTSRLYPAPEKIRELELVKRAIPATGAVLMGRRAYDMARGDMTDYEFQVPLFVLTHNPPAQRPKGENDKLKVHFINETYDAAVARARDAAHGRDVMVVGGVSVIRELLQRGLVDELVVGVAAVMLGGGLRLFQDASGAGMGLEQVEAIAGPGRTDVRYRVIGAGRQ